MVNAFTSGFRVTQAQAAISKSLHDAAAAPRRSSRRRWSHGILVREQMTPAQFESVPAVRDGLARSGSRPPAPIDQQIAAFLRFLPSLKGDIESEVAAVARR
jgi:hypothetical protein